MSYWEASGTLCSSVVSGGSKTFTIPESQTGYYQYITTITTYKCAFASCIGGFDYTIHVNIRDAVNGSIVYSTLWKAPFNPSSKSTISISELINLPPNTAFVMEWAVYPVDAAGGCTGFGCILCADIDMRLYTAVPPVPSPSPSPPPSPTPTPPPTSPTPIAPPIYEVPWWVWFGVGAAVSLGLMLVVIEGLKARGT